jgi:8-oxo-dGTP pyrophosphatase MutT (NUDIX family)
MGNSIKRVACVLLVNHQGKILGVSRGPGSELFGLPGGEVESGETDEEAAIRETMEETGLVISNLRVLYANYSVDPTGAKRWVTTFAADWQGVPRPSHEGDVRWIDVDKLLSGPFAVYSHGLLKSLGII